MSGKKDLSLPVVHTHRFPESALKLGQGLPMPSLYHAVRNAIACVDNTVCSPSEVMAVIYLETLGEPWFCECATDDKSKLQELPFEHQDDRSEFLARNRVSAGLNRTKLPRFCFDRTYYALIRRDRCFESLGVIDQVTLACNWGIALKSAYLLTLAEVIPGKVQALRKFQASPHAQIVMCVRDLNELIPAASGDFALAATHYKNVFEHRRIGDFGVRARTLAQRFQERGCV